MKSGVVGGGRESQTVLGGSLDPEREPCGLTNDHTVPAMNSSLLAAAVPTRQQRIGDSGLSEQRAATGATLMPLQPPA